MKTLLSLAFASLLIAGADTAAGSAAKNNVGQKVPDLKLNYLSSKPDTTGKPMVLEFWATWCGPCRTSIPHLNALHQKYKEKGLVIIGVTEEDNQTIRRFTKSVPMEYHPATDRNGKLSKEFAIQGIPHALLVNKSGEIVWEGHPMSLKESEIEKVLQ